MASKDKKIEESRVVQEVDGTLLTQTIVETTYFREGSDTPSRTETVDTRQIGDRVYTRVVVEGNIFMSDKTSMTDEEVTAFMEEWDAKWKPSIDESEVAKAQEVQQPIQSVEDGGAGVFPSHDNEDGMPEDQEAEENTENTIEEDNN